MCTEGVLLNIVLMERQINGFLEKQRQMMSRYIQYGAHNRFLNGRQDIKLCTNLPRYGEMSASEG